MKRSEDGGATWSKGAVLFDDAENVCGNPCAVLDGVTGVIHLLMTHNLGIDREHEIIGGTSKGTRTVWITSSADDGKTWLEPVDITPAVKSKDWTWYATGPGIGIQIERGPYAGRLVIPCDHIEAKSKRYFSHVLLSDDHGKSWRIGGRTPKDQLNECQVAEVSDGELVLNMRNYDRAQKARAVSRSKDGGLTFGEVSWDAALPDPICQAGLVSLSGQRATLYFSNCASETKRRMMTLKKSDDGGATWNTVDVLHQGPAAYSCLVDLRADRKDGQAASDATVGCLFECGDAHPYERIVWSTR